MQQVLFVVNKHGFQFEVQKVEYLQLEEPTLSFTSEKIEYYKNLQ